MRPAFPTTKSAVGFALLLLLLLILPAVMGKNWLPPREELYSSTTWRFGPFNHIRRQIFEEKADIDVVFIGSSRIWSGIDTPYVQQEFSKKLGRPAVVLTLGWAWNGYDALYFMTQDLLQNRKVRMLVFDDEDCDVPHSAAPHWFRMGDNGEALAGMPPRIQATYYFAAILGMPQNLLSLIRPNLPDELIFPENDHWKTFFQAPNSAARLGALASEQMITGVPFAPFVPQGDARPADVSVYSPATKDQFLFVGPPTAAWQLKFAQKFAALAQAHGVKLVCLHLLPTEVNDETNTPVVREREFLPETLHADVTMMGIPPAKLYSGINSGDLPRLFYTVNHFNRNGQAYFTRLITPRLLEIYETQTSH